MNNLKFPNRLELPMMHSQGRMLLLRKQHGRELSLCSMHVKRGGDHDLNPRIVHGSQ